MTLDELDDLSKKAEEKGFLLKRKPKPKIDWDSLYLTVSKKHEVQTADLKSLIEHFYKPDESNQLGIRELAKIFGVSSATMRIKMVDLEIERRSRGSTRRKAKSIQPELFGYENERELLLAWKEKLSTKQIHNILNTCDVKITFSTLQKRIQRAKKEEKNDDKEN